MRSRSASPRRPRLPRWGTARFDHAVIVAVIASTLVTAATLATGLLAPLDRALSGGWF